MRPAGFEPVTSGFVGWRTPPTAALRAVETHDALASYLDGQVPSADEHEDHWAAENAREAIREERW